MSEITEGCKAIVVAGVFEENIGKVVTVGNCVGDLDGFIGGPYWEVNQLMKCNGGTYEALTREVNLQRIDDDETKIETKQKLELEV